MNLTVPKSSIQANNSFFELNTIMYSKGEVQRAGESLIIPDISTSDTNRYIQAMKVLSYWRACHIHPLDVLAHELQATALKFDKKAIVAKRLKRTPSIITKLNRFESMKLRNMQDIGGCRVIVGTLKHVQRLKKELISRRKYKVSDYINAPKDDGYRGVHLVGKFWGEDGNTEYSIEIQLRTTIQHSWATAVEIIDLFTSQALKSDQGSQEWKDFFRFASTELATLDGGNTTSIEKFTKDLDKLSKKLDVFTKFEAYSSSLKILNQVALPDVDGYFLLKIDTAQKTLNIDFFNISDYEDATKKFLKFEKENVTTPQIVVALVSSNSVNGLQEAYPNYFADSNVFVTHLRGILDKYRGNNPGWIKKFILGLPSDKS